jgi:phospholipid N-methyltransferase
VPDLAVSFLKEFVSKPHEVGAIAPSSPDLAREVVGSVDWDRVAVVAEYGAGLGAITEEILKRIEGRDFFAIELNEVYADRFSRMFPQVPLYRDSVANVESIRDAHGADRIDCVISSLPWAIFSQELQDELLDATLRAMTPDGQFVTYAYLHGLVLPTGRRFRRKLKARFRIVERSRVVWRNTPPAVVYHCSR